MSNLVSISNQDILSDICYSHPKKSQGGCYVSNLYIKNQNDNFPVYLQTPSFLFNNIKIDKNVALIDIVEDDKLTKFFDLVSNIENKAKKVMTEKSQEWFKTAIDESKAEELFSSKISVKNNNRVIQLKIPVKDNELQIDLIDKDNKRININEIENKMIIGIIQIDELKFLKSKTHLELILVKMQLQSESLFDLITSCQEDIIINKNNNIQFLSEDEDNDADYDKKSSKFTLSPNIDNIDCEDIDNTNLQPQIILDGENDLDYLIENNQIALDNLEKVDIDQYEEFMFNSETEGSQDSTDLQENDENKNITEIEDQDEHIETNKSSLYDTKIINQNNLIKDLELEYEKSKVQYEDCLKKLLFEKNKLEEYLIK